MTHLLQEQEGNSGDAVLMRDSLELGCGFNGDACKGSREVRGAVGL